MEQTYSHDKQYKMVFSNPIFVEKLLISFVHEDFVQHLDFSKMTQKNTTYIIPPMDKYESDIVFEIYYKEEPIYIYILLEFQSTPDYKMPVRFLRYILGLYEHNGLNKKSKQYPAVFPILLYNGEKQWTAKINISDIIEHTIPAKYIPNFEYCPILINEIDKNELLKINNAVSAIFYIENIESSEYHEAIDKLVELIKDSSSIETTVLATWLNNIFARTGKGLTEIEITRIKTSEEALPMFVASLERYKEELLREGMDIGKKQWLKQGLEQGLEQGKSIERREMALTLIKEGTELQFVSKVTGFTITELKALTSSSIQ